MQVREDADRTTLLIRGPVRLGEVPELLEHARAVSARAMPVEIDLAEAEHLHTAAWQVLMSLEREVRRRGHAFHATNAPDAAVAMLGFLERETWLRKREDQL